jgi:hypothetical protein
MGGAPPVPAMKLRWMAARRQPLVPWTRTRVALVAAAGVVAGGDDRRRTVDAGLHLGEAEAVVAEVA